MGHIFTHALTAPPTSTQTAVTMMRCSLTIVYRDSPFSHHRYVSHAAAIDGALEHQAPARPLRPMKPAGSRGDRECSAVYDSEAGLLLPVGLLCRDISFIRGSHRDPSSRQYERAEQLDEHGGAVDHRRWWCSSWSSVHQKSGVSFAPCILETCNSGGGGRGEGIALHSGPARGPPVCGLDSWIQGQSREIRNSAAFCSQSAVVPPHVPRHVCRWLCGIDLRTVQNVGTSTRCSCRRINRLFLCLHRVTDEQRSQTGSATSAGHEPQVKKTSVLALSSWSSHHTPQSTPTTCASCQQQHNQRWRWP